MNQQVDKTLEIVENKENGAMDSCRDLKNGAERFLGTINIILLILAIIFAVMLPILGPRLYGQDLGADIVISVSVLFTTLIYCSVVKVVLNISNNLHQINAKLK